MDDESTSRQRWLSPLLSFARREGELHPYGSPEWNVLPDGSWRKIAAACLAGECWARDGDELESRVFDEWWATRAEDDAYWAGVDARSRGVVLACANWPTMAERIARGYIPRRLP